METRVSLHRLAIAVAFAASMASVWPAAHAVPDARPAIDGVDVEQVAALGAGVPLRFTVYGTPASAVALQIEGGRQVLEMRESEPGIYEGSYVIESGDAIGPASRVTATLQRGGQLVVGDLDEPLLLAEAPLPWADAAQRASLPDAPRGAVPAPTTARAAPPPGAARRDVPSPVAPPRPLSEPATQFPIVVARAPERPSCADCAFVEAVREVDTSPARDGGAAGAFARAVLGDELGEAHTRRMLRLVDAIRGAVEGRPARRGLPDSRAPQARYEVVLRNADGSREVRRYDQPPPFAPGATVRLGDERERAAARPF